ncbi:hypothetical protein BGW38_004469, partial [Lunasporangiospora selenospora]
MAPIHSATTAIESAGSRPPYDHFDLHEGQSRVPHNHSIHIHPHGQSTIIITTITIIHSNGPDARPRPFDGHAPEQWSSAHPYSAPEETQHRPRYTDEYEYDRRSHDMPPPYSSRPKSPFRNSANAYQDSEERNPYHRYLQQQQQHQQQHQQQQQQMQQPLSRPSHYPDSDRSPQSTRHSEGYQGHVRNTTRDHNDHLVTSADLHTNSHDQQLHHSQYRRDPAYGRHMRYFSKVTSQDREDRHGYYSSARHVAPSNTSGNFGHGPPIGQALDRFVEKQRKRQLQEQQQQQQQQPEPEHEYDYEQEQSSVEHRLPSLYAALPEQRPVNKGPSALLSNESPMERSSSSISQSQALATMVKPKTIQPRSIAPAPVSPPSPMQQGSPIPGRAYARRNERVPYIKIEPKELSRQTIAHEYPSPQPSQHSMSMGTKRKWTHEHSPVRAGPRLNGAEPSTESATMDQDEEDEFSQELHLLSRRHQRPIAAATASQVNESNMPLRKKSGHAKTRMQRYQMTTVRCWHGAIAQKSYGIEKRYLCPPPMVHVSAGLNAKQIRGEHPHVTMTVIHEKVNGPVQGESLMEQDCSLDDHLRCSFRNLHVTGTGSDSSKRFKLGLQVYLNKSSNLPTAIMDSNPIPIISKPSKKTAKAGNASCFILNGMSVSLLNRINAQTVRTKYMAVDNKAVCAKIGTWSSFTIKMVKPPPAPPVKTVSASMGVFRAPSLSTKFVPIRMKGDPAPIGSVAPNSSSSSGSAGMRRDAALNASSALSSSGSAMMNNTSSLVSPMTPSMGSSSSSFQHQSFQFRHPQQLPHEPVYQFSNSEPVLYGSEIVLINDLTGIMTDRLIIRKVENGKVSRSGTGPVSQMQKIVLEHPERVHPEDGRAYYLSASSIGSPKIEGKIPLQAAMDRSPLLEYRTSSKKASIMDMTDQGDDENAEDDEIFEDGDEGISVPRRMNKVRDCVAVDDFVCWTIAGIAKFDYTYFGPIPAALDSEVDPTKVPTVLSAPQYSPQTNTMTMKVKNVFEKLSHAQESVLAAKQQLHQNENPYDRRLTLSEY